MRTYLYFIFDVQVILASRELMDAMERKVPRVSRAWLQTSTFGAKEKRVKLELFVSQQDPTRPQLLKEKRA